MSGRDGDELGVWYDTGGWTPPENPTTETLTCFTDADLAAHDAQVRAEALAPIEALAEEWDQEGPAGHSIAEASQLRAAMEAKG